MKISAVIPVYNEDPNKLKTTLTTMRESVYDGTDLEIILVDDGSKRPIKSEIANKIIRNEPGIGAMQSINLGLDATTGDVLTSWDSHMRLRFKGTFETLAEKVLQERCIATLPSQGYAPDAKGQLKGCYLYWNRQQGIQPRWRSDPISEEEWIRVPGMMGADYGMSRDTMEFLKSLTGNVWDNIRGRWGFGEQSMAVKCFLSDVPIYLANHHPVGHFYRSTNPLVTSGVPVAKECWRNICYSMALLLSPKVYANHFQAYIEKHLGKNEPKKIFRSAIGDKPDSYPWSLEDERKVFTHLMGFKSPIVKPHSDYKWLRPALDSVDKADIDPHQILIWRPNEVLFELMDRFPNARIFCVEHAPKRLTNWRPIITPLKNVSLIQTRLNKFAEAPKQENLGTFDMAFICGERKEDCKDVAKSIVENSELIYVSDTNMANQLEHGDRKAEEVALRDYKPDVNEKPSKPKDNTEHDWMPIASEWVEKIKPSRILEWSADPSSRKFWKNTEADVTTIDHNDRTDVVKVDISNAGPSKYSAWPLLNIDAPEFDIIFVDGRRRVECLVAAREMLSHGGVVIIHDAERENYQHGIRLFRQVGGDERTRVLRKPR
jgi:hypothetical protein